MLNLKKIGEKITLKRKQKGLTQLELADTLYVTHQAVSKWENGKSIPSIEILVELTKLFNISIDYLLENSEIKDNDYQAMFSQYSRDAVLAAFFQNQDINKEIKNIFYLLNQAERALIIDRIIAGKLAINIESIWPYLNISERSYLLGVILSNKYDYDLSLIKNQLSNEELNIARLHIKNGNYLYNLFNHK